MDIMYALFLIAIGWWLHFHYHKLRKKPEVKGVDYSDGVV